MNAAPPPVASAGGEKSREAQRAAEPGVPGLAESIFVLGLLAAVGASCWLLYGAIIRQMFIVIRRYLLGE